MKKICGIFLITAFIAMGLSSCERNCYCKNVKDGSEGIMYGAYSKKDCSDTEDYYNELYGEHLYECTYK